MNRVLKVGRSLVDIEVEGATVRFALGNDGRLVETSRISDREYNRDIPKGLYAEACKRAAAILRRLHGRGIS